ncbi:MAG: regulatory particle non-ATPase [Chaenotheca gracillima]|nr:MAG: regulatory particle non-ATPase [Chaenotheca gracillima]
MAHYNHYGRPAHGGERYYYGGASAGQQHSDQQKYYGMNNQQQRPGGYPPQVGATFYPGGSDDFYMPEVISPAPQRMIPQVPDNIQQNLATLELEGSSITSPPLGSPALNRSESMSTVSPVQSSRPNSFDPQASRSYRDAVPRSPNPIVSPTFSVFPKLHNPPPNVPPSDDSKEETLEQARNPVLSSNDPEMQLAWAEDALAYVEIAHGDEIRSSEIQPARAQTPQTEHQLRVDAINVVSFLADQHHPRAEFMRGMWLEFGKFGFRTDPKEAFMCYTRSAEKGYGRAEYRIGMQFENSNDQVKAIHHYNRGVSLGDSASHYRLGMMTLLGQHGQTQDYARGVALVRYAAEHADENAPQGAYVYGMLQARELEAISIPDVYLPLDISGARISIEKAAYLGFAKAQVKMGAAYELGQLGCEFSPALSLHYNALASRQGEPDADMAISKWFLCGYDGVFERNDGLAYKYAQRAAQGGLATAEFAMGYFHEVGINTPSDLKKASKWYEQAAEHGNKDALGRIDSISRSKTLSRNDHEKVAIERIKSTYGSQRGNRPDRFKTPKPAMPTIPDGRIDMPDPRASTPGYLNAQGNDPNLQRPASAAPYPLEGPAMQGGLRPINGVFNPNVRPSSAFGINPNIRANTSLGMPTTSGPQPMQYQGGNGPAPLQRPLTSVEGVGMGRGRGGPAGRGMRVVSGGPPGPSNYRMPGGPGAGGMPDGARPPELSQQPQAPRLDIGYSAPPDPSVERKSRLQKTNAPMTSKPQPPLPGQSQGTPLNPYLKRPSQQSNAPPSPNPDYPPPRSRTSNLQSEPARPGSAHPPSPNPGQPTRPTRVDSKPAAALPSQQPSKPSKQPGAPEPPSKPSKQPTMPAASMTPKPPGKGPKTFEEMGVPQANKEGECVVM